MADIKVLPIQNKNIQPITKHNTPIETTLGVLHQHKITAYQQPKNTNAQNSTLLGENVSQPLAQMLNDPLSAMQYTVVLQTLKELLSVPDLSFTTSSSPLHVLFNALYVSAEYVVSEMMHQNADTTLMQGSLFELIRGTMQGATSEIQDALMQLVIKLNTLQQQPFIKTSLENQFQALQSTLEESQRHHFDALLSNIKLADSNENIVKHINALLKYSETIREDKIFCVNVHR